MIVIVPDLLLFDLLSGNSKALKVPCNFVIFLICLFSLEYLQYTVKHEKGFYFWTPVFFFYLKNKNKTEKKNNWLSAYEFKMSGGTKSGSRFCTLRCTFICWDKEMLVLSSGTRSFIFEARFVLYLPQTLKQFYFESGKLLIEHFFLASFTPAVTPLILIIL